MSFASTFLNRASAAGITAVAFYGLVARALVHSGSGGEVFPIMTIGFLVLVPVAVGYLAVRPAPKPSVLYQNFSLEVIRRRCEAAASGRTLPT